MRNKIITAGLALAVALTATACGPSPTATGQGGRPAASATTKKAAGAPQRFDVGQHAIMTFANGDAADVVVNSVKVQGKLLIVTVTVTCTAGSMSYNTFDWSMLAGDGTKIDREATPDVKNQLASGDLAPGQKVTGTIVFQGTAEQAKGAQVQYSVGLETSAYWVNP